MVSGYGREGFGELCLLAFTHAQVRNRGIGVIVLFGLLKWMRVAPGLPSWSAVAEARRRARACAWLAEQSWEELLPLPLSDVRKQLRIPPAPVYAGAKESAVELEAGYAPQAA